MKTNTKILYRKNCKVCRTIKADLLLKRRIYASTVLQDGSERLADIQQDYEGQFHLSSLYNHVKRHQVVNTDVALRHNTTQLYKKDAERRAELAVQLEKGIRPVVLPEKSNFENVWDVIIDLGTERLERGEIKVTPSNLMRAAKDKSDYSAGRQDTQLEIARMMYEFASGERTAIDEVELN